MKGNRICAITVAILIVFTFGTANVTMAGEKVKSTATSINTKWHHIDVGDEEGHMIAVYENKQVWVDDNTGEITTAISRGMMDFNTKTGEGTLTGYSEITDQNGDKWFSRYEGKRVGKGLTKGTYTYTGGTGKHQGLTGGGTWESQSLARGISKVVAEGEKNYPSQ